MARFLILLVSIILSTEAFATVDKQKSTKEIDYTPYASKGEVEYLDKRFRLYDRERSTSHHSDEEWLKVKRTKGLYQDSTNEYKLSNRAMNDEIGKSSKYRGIDVGKIGEGSTESIGITGSIKLP